MHGITSTSASSRLCMSCARHRVLQSPGLFFPPHQELGQTPVLPWPLCLGFLPVGAATLCKVGGGRELVYNQVLS